MSYTEQNKAWCLNQKWRAARWETLKYTFGEGALVRYVDEPALADMEGLVEFLLDAESCANLKVNEKRVHGTYVPAAAWWETVTVRGAERVRLYHECVPADAAGSGTAYVTENGCTYTVTMTPYFRQAAVAAPPAGTSGVSYRITGERADPRTGLWMFTLEKREQKTTTTGVVTVRDDAFATVTEQTFYGVRTGNTDHTGAAVSGLWTAGVSPAGTLVENVQVRKNENCTTDVTQRKTVAKAREATVERVQTKFETGVTITLRNQATAVNAFVAVAGGVITRQSSKDNGDGTFDNTQTVTTAVAASNAVIERYKTAFEMGVTITNRNQAAAVNAFVAVAGGVITRRSSKLNDNGKFDNTETVTTAVAVSEAVVERYQTKFETGVTITNRNQAEAVNEFVDVAGGIITRRSSKENDDGTFDNTETVTTAVAVSDATVERYQTAFETGVKITNRNQAAAVNEFVDVAGGVITRQSSKDNGDGTFDNTETVTTAVAVSNAVVERYQTAFETGVTITNRNQAAAVNAFVAVAGGVITRRSSKENDDGTFDNTETVTTAAAAANATVERYRTLYEEGVTVTNRNQSAAVDAFVDVADGIITRQGSKLNDNGTFDNTQRLTAAIAVTDATVESTGDIYGSRTRKAQRNQAAADSTTPGLTNAGTANAKITAVTNVKTEAGRYDQEKSEDTPSAAGSAELTFTGDKKTVTLIVFWNQTQTGLQALATALGTVANVSVSAHPNKWALLDGSLTATVEAAGGSTEWSAWETPVDELERLPSGELLRLQGTAVFGYNVSDGASTFYGAKAYRQYSWFRDVGRGWFTYKLITSVTPVAGVTPPE